MVSIVLGLAVLGFAAALASASPSTGQYDTTTVTTVTTGTSTESTTTGAVAGVHGAGKGPTSKPTSVHAAAPAQQKTTLPFTGQSLTWIVVAGVMLVLLGLTLRRRGRSSSSS